MLNDVVPFLRVRAFHRCDASFGHLLQEPDKQLRGEQCKEFSEHYNSDRMKMLPKGLSKPSMCPLVSDIPGMVQKYAETKLRQQEEENALKSLVPTGAPGEQESMNANEGAEQDDEQDDNIILEPLDGGCVLPSALAADAKKKKKEKAAQAKAKAKSQADARRFVKPIKPKSKWSAKSMPRPSCSTARSEVSSALPADARSAMAENDDAATVAESTVGGTGAVQRAKRKERLLKKAAEWPQLRKPKQFLDGELQGRENWQMRSTLEALQRMGDLSPPTVFLQAHVDLCTLAEDCNYQ